MFFKEEKGLKAHTNTHFYFYFEKSLFLLLFSCLYYEFKRWKLFSKYTIMYLIKQPGVTRNDQG